ncbi:ribbon-helix-helix domain-containing protein [Psychrobacillus phage Perkons]|nr:ribbon-helix-helix domain-containing protein [Psychrobacillus phage Perkons]
MVISIDNDRLTVIISKKTKKELKLMAKEDNRSLSNFVSTLLENYVSDKLNKDHKS